MNLSDNALELLDGMVELGATGVSGGATSSDLMRALDIRDLSLFADLLRVLLDGDFIRRRMPTSISDTVHYYVNMSRYEKFIADLDEGPASARVEIGEEIREKLVTELNIVRRAIEVSTAGNAEKAQALAYVDAVNALAEAPNPPRDLIWDLIARANNLAGIASLFVSIIALLAVTK